MVTLRVVTIVTTLFTAFFCWILEDYFVLLRKVVLVSYLFYCVLWISAEVHGLVNGGGGEIRTHGRVTPTAVFKTAALNRSATPPSLQVRIIPFSTLFG